MAKVVAHGILARAYGSTGRKVWGSSEAEKSGVTMQRRRGTTVISVKRDRIQHSTQKQQAQRSKFCSCDLAYRKLTNEQRRLFRQYATELNKKYKKKYSCHTWWMKLCMENKLNEFFEKYLHLEFTETVEEEHEDKICYTVYVKRKDKEFIDKNIFTDIGVVRR